MRTRPTSVYRRRRAVAAGLVTAAVIAAAVVAVNPFSSGQKRFAPAAGNAGNHYDPLAFDSGKQAQFEQRAAAGLAHVIYEKSPGGVVASARRTAQWRPLIERAVRGAGIDPDLVEGIVMLESAGRPDIIAGNDPEAAAGLSQILAGTATDLLGMHVNLEASRRLTKRIATAEALGKRRAAARLRAARRRVDDRFNPARAIPGTVRYLTTAKKRFGRDDLAVASYHMGIGNLETVLRLFTGAGTDQPIAKVVADDDLSYAGVYFGSTPLLHPLAYGKLASFGDDSSTYLWRVLAAREIMQLYRRQPQRLQQLAALHKAGHSAELVLHPPGTPAYADLQAVERAIRAGQLVDPPAQPEKLGLAFAMPPGPLRALRLPALSALLYIGVGTKDIGGGGLLTVTRAVRRSPATRGHDHDQLHATGYEFDIARRYRDHRQALAFQFMLDRLQTLNLIAWRRDADKIHIVVADSAGQLLPDVARLARDASRQP